MTDFFKHGNKVYSENLNDGILVGNSFDWTVNISLPGDTGGVFPNTTTVVKAKVADCSITPNSNLSIGETITNNAGSSQVYRLTVYPNFNRYGGFTSVSLIGDGDVIITEVGASAPIRNNLDYSDLGDVVELKQLKEYDLVVTIPSGGVVTGLSFGFKSSSADVTASINQSNVTGLESDLSSLESGKADIMHSHATSVVYERTALSNIGTRANALQSEVNGAVDNKIGSLSTSITNLNNRVKSGKVNGISVQKQNVASYTVTHNLGRPNVPVVTLNIGNSNSYAWANTQATVYDVTNNDFKVKIYNDYANGSFSFNWVVVATD